MRPSVFFASLFLFLLTSITVAVAAKSSSSLRRRSPNKPSSSLGSPPPIAIESMTPHSEVWEGTDVELRCVVALEEEDTPHVVEWLFVPAADEEEEESRDRRRTYQSDVAARGGGDGRVVPLVAGETVLVSADDGDFGGGERLGASVRRRWDAVEDANLEEHFLRIRRVSPEDQGLYICQVKASSSPVAPPVAYSHCLISVVPYHEQGERRTARPVRTKDGDEVEVFPTAHTAPLTRATNEDALEPDPTLGPVTERFVVVSRGADVVLECRDADDNWVYWRKRGDPAMQASGRRLRLFRVDRWDSGVYYCSTNASSLNSRAVHNMTLVVEHPPKVEFALGAASATSVAQAEGHEAVIICKVESVPVARVTWYRVTSSLPRPTLSSDESSTFSSGLISSTLKQVLRSGDDLSLSITEYKDGVMESTLRIPRIREEDYGVYRCEARNSLGESSAEIALERSDHPVDFENLEQSSGGSGPANHQRISPLFLLLLLLAMLLATRHD